MAHHSTLSTDPGWPPGIQGHFLRRLWRPWVRPGLFKRQQGEAMLARYQQMVTVPSGHPLLTALRQRDQGLFEGQAAQVPIVYAQPSIPVVSGAVDTQVVDPLPPGRPVVRATPIANRPPVAAPVPNGSTLASPNPASATMVVQRKAASGAPLPPMALQTSAGERARPTPISAASASAASAPALATAQPALPPSVQPSGPTAVVQRKAASEATARTPAAGTLTMANALPIRPQRRAPVNIAPMPPLHEQPLHLAARADRTELTPGGAISSLGGLTGATVPVTPAVRRAAASSKEAALPLVRPLSPGETPPFRPVVRGVPLPGVNADSSQTNRLAAEPARAPTVLVVREQTEPARVRLPELPVVQAPAPPVSAMAPAMQASFTPAETSVAANRGYGGATTAAVRSPALRQETIAASATAAPAPAPAPIDLDRIVEKVERKFMQRLAAESERRGRNR